MRGGRADAAHERRGAVGLAIQLQAGDDLGQCLAIDYAELLGVFRRDRSDRDRNLLRVFGLLVRRHEDGLNAAFFVFRHCVLCKRWTA